MKTVTDCSDAELSELVQELSGQPFQARQLTQWVFKQGAKEYADCHNLPRGLRTDLERRLPLLGTRVTGREVSHDGTVKLLLTLHDDETIEIVLIPEGERTTLCVSTQVGCPVGCVFCASGLDGVRRNLTCGEIVEQVLHGQRELPAGRKLTNLVVMGIGEPMLNLDALLPALHRIHDKAGINLGARRITVSTAGFPEHMARFASEPYAYNLAVSLHAADDDVRRRLVPTARCTVDELVGAARRYFDTTGRRVTFEVVLLAEVNDRAKDADLLVRKLSNFPTQINLLPWNPVAQIKDLARPSQKRVRAFADRLRAGGLNVTVRKQRGADRSAACGQLRIQARSGQELGS